MSPLGLSAEIVTRRDAFAALATEWSELFDDAANPAPWRRHGWLALGWHRGARAVIVREAGVPVMAGAFVQELRRLRPIIRFLRAPIPQTDDLLYRASPRHAEQAELLLRTLAQGLWLPRQVRSDRLPEASPLHAAADLPGRAVLLKEQHNSFFVPVRAYASFDAYIRSLNPTLRLDHRRRVRRLGEMGRLEVMREPLAEVGDSLDWILANKRQWLERTGNKADWLSSGAADIFLRQWPSQPDAGPASMWTLRIDGKIVAASLVFEERIGWTAHIIAHDTNLNQYSPGRSLNLIIIERAFEEGVERVEFGMSGDHWKERITRHRELVLSKRFRLK